MQKTRTILFSALALHAFFWTFAPTLFLSNYQIDTMEMIIIGQHWVLSTFKHPAFQGWVAEVYAVLFNRAEFVPYLAAQTACVLCVLTVYRFALRLLSPQLAVLAALTLLSYFYFHYDSTVYNNRTFMRLFYILAVFFLYLSVTENKKRYWILTGLALGLGLYCKFTIFVLIASVLIYLFIDSQGRKYWKTPGPYLSTGVCFLVFLPLLIWLFQSDFAMFRYAEHSIGKVKPAAFNRLFSPVKFFYCQIPIVAVLLIPLYPMLLPPLGTFRFQFDKARLCSPAGRFLLSFIAVPLLLQMFAAGYFAGDMRAALGCHLWLLLPLFLLYTLKIPETRQKKYPLCVKIVFVNIVFFAVGTICVTQFAPLLTGRDSRYHFPGETLAEVVNAVWTQRYDAPLSFVRGDDICTESVGCYLYPPPSVYSPLWAAEADFRNKGGILLWFIADPGTLPRRAFKDNFGNDDFVYNKLTGQAAADWLAHFPTAEILPPLELKANTILPVPPIKIGIAVIPPQKR
ncbi:MAG: glycosyltransferase family 39 protein [Planctomycetaceae bacterium]|jgi:4-amino-4-deoxy-L-arabinose transferase-like glycosyltransferase|nr:glycosyltransferase family 39 protein [Planctomycetaceae bacterium]